MTSVSTVNNYLKLSNITTNKIEWIRFFDDFEPNTTREWYDTAIRAKTSLGRRGIRTKLTIYRLPDELRGLPLHSVLVCRKRHVFIDDTRGNRRIQRCRVCGVSDDA